MNMDNALSDFIAQSIYYLCWMNFQFQLVLFLTSLSQAVNMVLMKYFFFYFPVRLGVIFTSIFSGIQGSFALIYVLLHDEKHYKNVVKDLEEKIDEFSSNEAFNKLLILAGDCKH